MKAYYFAIYEFGEFTYQRGAIVYEGIRRYSEDTIYPRENTGIDIMPHQCEAHKFLCDGYRLEGWYFSIDREFTEKNKSMSNY